MILRFSAKLGRKIHEVPDSTVERGIAIFTDWSGHLFRFERVQYILVSNSHALFSTVIYGRGVKGLNSFISTWLAQLRDLHEHYGLEAIYDYQIAPTMGNICISKVGSRSVTGSMNDLCYQAQCMLSYNELSPFDISLRLNETPMGAIDMEFPIERYCSFTPRIIS